MCIDMKISNTANKDKRKTKYEMGNFCEQYGLPSVAPSRRHKPHKNLDKTPKRFKNFKKRRFESNEFYKTPQHRSKSRFNKPKQRSKEGCYKCGKKGHFAVDCKAKKTIKQLQISNEDKENLIKVLDIRDTESSEPDSDYSVSNSSSNSSHSDAEQKCQNISFGCQDTCCNTIKVLTKTEEHEELLLELISKIEDPGLKTQYLKKLKKLLTLTINKLTHMSMVANSYYNNHMLNQIEVLDLLITGFPPFWYQSHLTLLFLFNQFIRPSGWFICALFSDSFLFY
jgi:hypothetical protein